MKRIGFTLAELLVVLGIIGIVAMLTIPALMQSYQKKAWVTQLQKSMSTLQNGFAAMLANDEVEKIDDTEFAAAWGAQGYHGCAHQMGEASQMDESTKILKKYFKTNKELHLCNSGVPPELMRNLSTGTSLHMNTYTKFYLTDGSSVYFYLYGKNNGVNGSNFRGFIAIDVNGDKEPNTWGRDLFYFGLLNNGEVMAVNTERFISEYGNALDNGCNPETSNGWGCAARIIDEGWVMNY